MKTSNTHSKRLYKDLWRFLPVLFSFFLFSPSVIGQVTIGADTSPEPSAVLDLQSNNKLGLLLPRVALASTGSYAPLGTTHVAGMSVYNTATTGDVSPGIYYNDGTKWVRNTSPEWFYMPSFNLPVTAVGTGQTFDLHAEYERQFTQGAGNPQFVSSNSATTTVRPVYASGSLYYYVTAYPESVITINSISPAGVLNYDVLSLDIPEGSFINVIFVVK